MYCSGRIFDSSIPDVYKAKVINKRISSGETTTYHLELEPVGSKIEEDEYFVSQSLYERIEPGDEVSVYLKDGWFNIRWAEVTE